MSGFAVGVKQLFKLEGVRTGSPGVLTSCRPRDPNVRRPLYAVPTIPYSLFTTSPTQQGIGLPPFPCLKVLTFGRMYALLQATRA